MTHDTSKTACLGWETVRHAVQQVLHSGMCLRNSAYPGFETRLKRFTDDIRSQKYQWNHKKDQYPQTFCKKADALTYEYDENAYKMNADPDSR